MDMKAAMRPGPANTTHFATDSERYVTCYQASLDTKAAKEEVIIGDSKDKERRAALAERVRRRRQAQKEHHEEEAEKKETDHEKRRAARIEMLARLQEEQSNFVQSGRARPHDIAERKAEAQNRFHMAPSLEQQRLRFKKKVALAYEEKAEMDQQLHEIDESLHNLGHKKQVERYKGFVQHVVGAKEDGEKATVQAHRELQRRYGKAMQELGDHNQEKEDKRLLGLRNDQARYQKFADDVKKRDETVLDSEKEAKRISGLKNDQARYERFAADAQRKEETRQKGLKTELAESVPAARRSSAVGLY